MEQKQTNLCLAADLADWNKLTELVKKVGHKICVLKTHLDIINNLPADFIDQLIKLKNLYDFLIFEDRKFADIGHTVQRQYAGGFYKIADWADIINCHILPGPGIIEGLREIGLPKGQGLLLLAQMSSAGNLLTDDYAHQAVELAKKYDDFVIGFIGMRKMIDDDKFINLTPGIQLTEGGDNLGQQYNTPENVIKNGSDIIIVGRGIYEAGDPLTEAEKYRTAAWQAYQNIQ
ncbi:MAG: Orotidine 5'-phosphate decarboxylase [Parcubacteria group bacterium GW2011_GWF2_45_11]|nr:MAG: Orotidine 5'-phosphate decarboxylase [Parcubacteria group bacterium GW2011_GWF2_45_11]KKT96436.1 MAG: Orotidine 5'-phosphate decarboxylase [Parcubacteria group bacterium GW2011_GWC2_45_15]